MDWDQRFGHAIHHARRIIGGWAISDLALAAHMIVRFLPDPLHFADNAEISSSTNPLEGYFSRVEEKYRRHRALPRKYREHYFQRYFFLHLDEKQQHFLSIIPAMTVCRMATALSVLNLGEYRTQNNERWSRLYLSAARTGLFARIELL